MRGPLLPFVALPLPTYLAYLNGFQRFRLGNARRGVNLSIRLKRYNMAKVILYET